MSSNGRSPDSDDFFSETRMSFGDHIEELRWHLVRAIVGFCIALAASMFVGHYVLRFISEPVEYALGVQYEKRAERLKAEYLEKHPPGTSMVESKEDWNVADLKAALSEMGVTVRAAADDANRFVAIRTRKEMAVSLDEFHQLNKIIGQRPTLKVLNVIEGFMVWFKVCIVTGFVLASPWVFYQIWSFIAAGLYPHEKKYVNRYLPFSIGLFFLGVAMCQFIVIPSSLQFLLSFNAGLNFDSDLRLNEWLSFAIWVPLLFGLSFQTPLVMLFLERIGIGTVAGYRSWRKVAILGMLLCAAFVTPTPDPYTWLFLGVPMVLLYELGILLCKMSPRPELTDLDVPASEEMVEV